MELGPGKVAVVTGAASGIGLALANAFAAAGCSVVLAKHDLQSLLDRLRDSGYRTIGPQVAAEVLRAYLEGPEGERVRLTNLSVLEADVFA